MKPPISTLSSAEEYTKTPISVNLSVRTPPAKNTFLLNKYELDGTGISDQHLGRVRQESESLEQRKNKTKLLFILCISNKDASAVFPQLFQVF